MRQMRVRAVDLAHDLVLLVEDEPPVAAAVVVRGAVPRHVAVESLPLLVVRVVFVQEQLRALR